MVLKNEIFEKISLRHAFKNRFLQSRCKTLMSSLVLAKRKKETATRLNLITADLITKNLIIADLPIVIPKTHI